MKRLITNHAAIAICAMAAFFLTSCIYDSAGDKFYRTLWEADDVPLDPLPVNGLTLEFLCGNSICISTDTRADAAFGTYACNDQTAVFQDLTLDSDGVLITFIDAQRSGDTLYLRWCTEGSPEPSTTAMHRLSASKQ